MIIERRLPRLFLFLFALLLQGNKPLKTNYEEF